MSKVEEIESALRQLPAQERLKAVRRLIEELEDMLEELGDSPPLQPGLSTSNGGEAPPLPDYAARRRRIFGDKILPNMVLVARAEERW